MQKISKIGGIVNADSSQPLVLNSRAPNDAQINNEADHNYRSKHPGSFAKGPPNELRPASAEAAARAIAQHVGMDLKRVRRQGKGSDAGFKTCCPVHGGEDPNCSVNEGKDGKLLFCCHSHGCDSAEIAKAVEDMGIEVHGSAQTRARPSKSAPRKPRQSKATSDKPKPEAVLNAPVNAPAFKLPAKYSQHWTYNDESGHPITHIARLDIKEPDEEDKKIFHPFTLRRESNGEFTWISKAHPSGNRVLFNLDQIVERADEPLMFNEGEKDATGAARLSFTNGYVLTTTQNGCGGAKHADTSPMAGKDIVVWSDNDEQGIKYADSIVKLARKHGALSVRLVKYPDGVFPDGWGLADDLPDGVDEAYLADMLAKADVAFDKSAAGGQNEGFEGKTSEPDKGNAEESTIRELVANTCLDDENGRSAIAKRFLQDCAVLTGGNAMRYIHMETAPDVIPIGRTQLSTMKRTINRYNKRDFLDKFEPAAYEASVQGRNVLTIKYLAAEWMKNPNRREYTGEKFLPGIEAPSNILNLWTGWGVSPAIGDWALLHEHIRENLCCGDLDYFEWVLDWIADMIQNPTRKPGTALVFRGLKGTGKSKLAEWLRYLCGQHGMILDKPDQISGRFNSHLADKLFLAADEATWGGRTSAIGSLNVLITGPTLPIEGKGRDIIEMPSYHRMMIIANDKWVVPASDDERRYFVQNVGNGRQKDYKFFAALDAQMLNGGAAAMFAELSTREIKGNVSDAPKTEALGQQVAEGLAEPMTTIVNMAIDGQLRDGKGDLVLNLSDSDVTAIEIGKLRSVIEGHLRGRLSNNLLGEASGKLKLKKTRPRTGHGNARGPECYVIPPLPELRARIEEIFGFSLETLTGGSPVE